MQVGDRVKHSRAFLRSVGWYTNVPKGGTVVAIGRFVSVQWDDAPPEPSLLHPANLCALHKLEPN